jgi:hypothetical protein
MEVTKIATTLEDMVKFSLEVEKWAREKERERIVGLIEEELQGWRECAGMGNTFAIESTLIRLRRQVNNQD